jgi:L-asparaginase II
MNAWMVEQRRGTTCEASHRVHACATDADGNVLWQVGADLPTTFRSAAKPFQLEVTLGLIDQASLAGSILPSDLALGSASHHGETAHIAGLEQLLAKLGCQRGQLYCGAHEPSASAAAHDLYARGQQPEVLHNNCSGKHAFMAAACAAHAYPSDYRPPSHPLQRAILQSLTQRVGMTPPTVTDGCGVPCFVLPLSRMAHAYAQLARETAQGNGTALGRIGNALLAHPILMSGSQAFDGGLIAGAGVIAKIGAQGLLCVAVPQLGVGVAIKIESGVDQVRPIAAHTLLAHFFPRVFQDPLAPQYFELRNVVGDLVGELACLPS